MSPLFDVSSCGDTVEARRRVTAWRKPYPQKTLRTTPHKDTHGAASFPGARPRSRRPTLARPIASEGDGGPTHQCRRSRSLQGGRKRPEPRQSRPSLGPKWAEKGENAERHGHQTWTYARSIIDQCSVHFGEPCPPHLNRCSVHAASSTQGQDNRIRNDTWSGSDLTVSALEQCTS